MKQLEFFLFIKKQHKNVSKPNFMEFQIQNIFEIVKLLYSLEILMNHNLHVHLEKRKLHLWSMNYTLITTQSLSYNHIHFLLLSFD